VDGGRGPAGDVISDQTASLELVSDAFVMETDGSDLSAAKGILYAFVAGVAAQIGLGMALYSLWQSLTG
jgi:hypothetical protein